MEEGWWGRIEAGKDGGKTEDRVCRRREGGVKKEKIKKGLRKEETEFGGRIKRPKDGVPASIHKNFFGK